MAAAALSLPLTRIASNQGSIAIKEHHRSRRRPSHNATSASPPNMNAMMLAAASVRFAPTTLTGATHSHTQIQVSKNTRAKASTSASSSNTASKNAVVLPVGRPLDPTFVAATVTVRKSPSQSHLKPQPQTSTEDLLATATSVAGKTAAVVSTTTATTKTTGNGNGRTWLIFPEKLIHYDPSKDPRLFAL